MRNDAGFVKVIKKVAKKNVHLLETRAGRHAPEIKRVAREVKGTFDKVYIETAEAVEEFLAKCTSSISFYATSEFRTYAFLASSSSQDFGSRARHQGAPPTVTGASRDLVSIHPRSSFPGLQGSS